MLAMGLSIGFVAAMIYAAVSDVMTMTIPNRISLALLALFPLTALAAGLPLIDFGYHLAAGVIVLVIGFALFAVGGFGGGDAKLLAAAALWIGLDQLLPFILHVAVFGGLLAAVILGYRQMPEIVSAAGRWSQRLYNKETGIPYGVAISAAALFTFKETGLYALIIS